MERSRIIRAACLIVMLGLPGVHQVGAAPSHAAVHYVPATPYLAGVLVSAADPRTVFISADLGSTANSYLVRSTDAGASWTDVGAQAGFNYHSSTYSQVIDVPVLAADGRHLYTTGVGGGGSPASSSRFVLFSADGGLTWGSNDGDAQNDCGDPQYGAGPQGMFPSPVDPRRVYTLVGCGGLQAGPPSVESSADGGASWHHAANGPETLGPLNDNGEPLSAIDSVVPDSALPNTVYVNLSADFTGDFAARSDDGGLTWSMVMTPTAVPAITSFAVATNPSEPGLLVARATDSGRKPDLIFLSADQGRTWRAGTCPGDLNGKCPTITLANVFGAGHNYALFPDGLHAFDGDGPSGPLLAVSDHLPVPIKSITSLQGGARPGDPIYLLAAKAYISTDAGASWQVLSDRILPTARPITPAPGGLAVPHAAHRVAAAFAATYRKLGTLVLGLPITEPYMEGTVLMQDFEHMQLEWQHGKVVVGDLGGLLDAMGADDNWGAWCVPPVKDSAKVLFFTKHDRTDCGYTVSGAFLRFFLGHGGLAVFGKPISTPYTRQNGDGSHRRYTMQLFQNARLELHPENANPAYRVELGLFGDLYLYEIGWLNATS
jgi:hypothetical protein